MLFCIIWIILVSVSIPWVSKQIYIPKGIFWSSTLSPSRFCDWGTGEDCSDSSLGAGLWQMYILRHFAPWKERQVGWCFMDHHLTWLTLIYHHLSSRVVSGLLSAMITKRQVGLTLRAILANQWSLKWSSRWCLVGRWITTAEYVWASREGTSERKLWS